MEIRVEVFTKKNFPDILGNELRAEIENIGISSVEEIRTVLIYFIDSDVSEEEIRCICNELLIDKLTQDYVFFRGVSGRESSGSGIEVDNGVYSIDVIRKRGVMDPVEATVMKGVRDLGIHVRSVKTARRFLITGMLKVEQIETIANKILSNRIIEDVFINEGVMFCKNEKGNGGYVFRKNTVELVGVDDTQLQDISDRRQLSLNFSEMKEVQKHFKGLNRNPTDVELETIAQTWSEHCMHKTLKGVIEYDGESIDDLLGHTIMKVTKELKKPWCVSVFKDNAGIIEFDDDYNVCFKVETHNHPSAIEPYGGANTGLGGVIRDTLGTGLGAKPILNTDVFCFGPLDTPQEKVPEGVLHPRRIFKGVVAGVRDYGNRMGIPTANGAIFFDERYLCNPLVYCGNVGLIPKDKCRKRAEKDDLILLVGGRTGRDGIHGATFSSAGLTQHSEVVSVGSVQIGNPIMEKKITDALLVARDRGLYHNITDCGAGGLSSAIGEMGEEMGVLVDLERVPLKYEGLSYSEIWISEAQERMILAVPPANLEELKSLFEQEDVEAVNIGKFTGDGRLRLRYGGETVADLEMGFLHKGCPRIKRKAVSRSVNHGEPEIGEKKEYGKDLKKILSSWNVCSKEWVIRQYDHEVQGGSVLKPLQGAENDGPGDACVVRPLLNSKKGIIVSNGMNPRYGDIDAYHMAASAIDEALRQIVSVGGTLEKVALLDNFSWGNTEDPESLGDLVRAAKGCYDTALSYETPFISGKDSLHNEFKSIDRTVSIPHSLLISALCIMDDVTKAVSMDVKEPGNLIYIVGITKAELGGSHYYLVHGFTGNSVPKVDALMGKRVMKSLGKAMGKGLVRSCHDCSEGGIAVASAEMSFAGGYGVELDLSRVPVEDGVTRDDIILFSETNSRFVVEVSTENRKEFERTMGEIPHRCIGRVLENDIYTVFSCKGDSLISEKISDLKNAWQATLKL